MHYFYNFMLSKLVVPAIVMDVLVRPISFTSCVGWEPRGGLLGCMTIWAMMTNLIMVHLFVVMGGRLCVDRR